jgi:hypothetical protein
MTDEKTIERYLQRLQPLFEAATAVEAALVELKKEIPELTFELTKEFNRARIKTNIGIERDGLAEKSFDIMFGELGRQIFAWGTYRDNLVVDIADPQAVAKTVAFAKKHAVTAKAKGLFAKP